jgi:excisionase family DNA binding protein
MAEDVLLTVNETAERLRLNPETVRRWLRAGKIRGVSWGSDRAGWRVAQSEIERFKREGPASVA